MSTYFSLGYQHILELSAYDHMLFIALLLMAVPIEKWKQIVGLITAFTIGHSISLAVTVLEFSLIPIEWIEFLIPITILLTGLSNLFQSEHRLYLYYTTAFFGIIHGMGFAGYLNALLPSSSIWQALLLFNLGVEAGQLIFASVVILCLLILKQYSPFKTVQTVRRTINIVGIAISLFLASQNWPL